MATLDNLKITLGIPGDDSSQDAALSLLLADVEADLLTWTNRAALLPAMEPLQRQIAVIRYNKGGIEGQTAHSEGGVSRSFEDLPEGLRLSIGAYRLAKLVKYATPTT